MPHQIQLQLLLATFAGWINRQQTQAPACLSAHGSLSQPNPPYTKPPPGLHREAVTFGFGLAGDYQRPPPPPPPRFPPPPP